MFVQIASSVREKKSEIIIFQLRRSFRFDFFPGGFGSSTGRWHTGHRPDTSVSHGSTQVFCKES